MNSGTPVTYVFNKLCSS